MIVDASVAIKWLTPEPDTAAAEAILSRSDLAAPDFLLLEIGGALTRLCRQGRMTSQQAIFGSSFAAGLPVDLTAWQGLTHQALGLSIDLGAAFYDCLYLALALQHDDIVVTADARFVRAVRSRPALNGRAILLSDLQSAFRKVGTGFRNKRASKQRL